MQRLVRGGSLCLLLVVFSIPTFAGDPGKKEGDPKKEGDDTKKQEKEKKEVKEKFVYGGKFVGKITAVDAAGANRDFTLQVTAKVQELDTGVQQQIANLSNQMATHLRSYSTARDA